MLCSSPCSNAAEKQVFGARHLHSAFSKLDLDFTVLYSSTAALLGAPGQGNYAAANVSLDAMAHDWRMKGSQQQ